MSSAINGYFTAVRRVYKNAFAKFFEEFVKIICTAFLHGSLVESRYKDLDSYNKRILRIAIPVALTSGYKF